MSETVAFDFDGVIHEYSGWKDGSIYGPISKDWVELVKELLDMDYDVCIITTRNKRQVYKHMKELFYNDEPSQLGLPCNNIWECGFGFRVMPFWEKFHKTKINSDGYKTVGICNHKASFDVFIDDKNIPFAGDYTGLKEKIVNFKPHWKKD